MTEYECWLPTTNPDNVARMRDWIRKWYPDYVWAGMPESGEYFIPSWFDGSQESVERLAESIRARVRTLDSERAERRSAG